MSYIDGIILAVPKTNNEKFVQHAETGHKHSNNVRNQ
ncbi:MAG: DUF1428 family protein [Ketobacter sp. GenoA1]|nr:MAG: DUF1428 family protein [Ketobacter sp. GenoA1]RLT98316.1 MAG: DUF1428 family protein [Ketobacter sp.]